MENPLPQITPQLDFNYDQICEFNTLGCNESGFTLDGLKKHNEEFLPNHLLLLKKKLEQNELKTKEEITKIKNDQAELAQIIYKISQKLDNSDIKSNELLSKIEQTLIKLGNIETNENIFLGQKMMRDEILNEIYNNFEYKNKRPKFEEKKINDENDNGKIVSDKKKNISNTNNNNTEKLSIKKEKNISGDEMDEKNILKKQETKDNDKDKDKEKYMNNNVMEIEQEKDKDKEKITTERLISPKNQIELIEEIPDNNKNKVKKIPEEKNIYLPIISDSEKDKEKEMKDLKEISLTKNPVSKNKFNYTNINSVLNGLNSNTVSTPNMKDFKINRDTHILNHKKIRWEILLKKLTGFCALGISGKRPEDLGTVILDNENEKEEEKIEEEIIPLPNIECITSIGYMEYLLTNKQHTIIWKNGNNVKKNNSNLPVLKEGDNLIFIYCPKFSQLKIQKGDYIFIFENVGNKPRQLLNPFIIFENKNDKAVFHNFQVLAEYKK